MKRTVILVLGVSAGVLLLILLGSILQIGDKLGEAAPALEYGFYALVAALFIAFVAVPVLKVALAPEMPPLSVGEGLDASALSKLGTRLTQSCGYIQDSEEMRLHSEALSESLAAAGTDVGMLSDVLNTEIDFRLSGDSDGGVKGIDRKIREWAGNVFLVTALSRNGKLDSLAMMVLNYKMIEDVVLSSGFRPTRPQMLKLYARVVITSAFSYLASEAIGDLSENINMAALEMEGAEETGGKFLSGLRKSRIGGVVLGSALDGALNALMTLRTGYVTRSYILQGAQALRDDSSRREVRRSAVRASYRNIGAVIASSASVIGKGAASRLMNLFSRE